MMTDQKDPIVALLDEWHIASELASKWQAAEKELREKIFETCFPYPTPKATNFKDVGFGKTLVGDYRLNYKVDGPALEAINSLANLSNVKAITDKIIRYRPEVKPAELEKLTADEKLAIADLITITPGLPGLEIKTTAKMRKR